MFAPRGIARRRRSSSATIGDAADRAGEAHRTEPAVDPTEQLEQLAELREQGVLDEDEFVAEKQKILAR